jgi:RHS repeat-associated protein
LRDDQNRIVTEMAGGSSGSSTATLSVTRDNVFLGNLLVASYVASPAGWQYTASDHLGSPRVMFNQSGQLVESHKYWPYGEDTAGVPPGQHLAFALMEKDDAATRYYDHARTHDYGLGRFLGPDRVGGTPENPQSWNRYAYTLGNPMKHVDPDGLLTIVVHGTFAHGSATFMPGGHFFQHVARTFGDRTVSFQWSGGDTTEARSKAAADLANYVRNYKFAPGEQLNIVAHSHGGNVVIQAINAVLGHRVDNLVTLGTPANIGYRLNETVKNFLAVSGSHDLIQVLGGRNFRVPFLGEFGLAGRQQPGVVNMFVSEPDGLLEAHGNLHESEFVWNAVSQLVLHPGLQPDQLQQQTERP